MFQILCAPILFSLTGYTLYTVQSSRGDGDRGLLRHPLGAGGMDELL